jgi:hypothetical protein
MGCGSQAMDAADGALRNRAAFILRVRDGRGAGRKDSVTCWPSLARLRPW